MQTQVQGTQFFCVISCFIFWENDSLKNRMDSDFESAFPTVTNNPFIAIVKINGDKQSAQFISDNCMCIKGY